MLRQRGAVSDGGLIGCVGTLLGPSATARGQPSGGQPAGDTDSSSEEGGEEAAAALAAKRAKKREAKEDEADCQRILTSGVASYEKFAKTQVRTRPELNIQRDVVRSRIPFQGRSHFSLATGWVVGPCCTFA